MNKCLTFCHSEQSSTIRAADARTWSRNLLSPLALKYGFCVFLVTFLFGAVAPELPTGWHRPTPVEAAGNWRNKSGTRFLAVNGNFDGDGKPDRAELLVSSQTKQFALFVRLSSGGNWQLLDKPHAMGDFDRFGIALVKPGKYETACGKGYGDWVCAHREPDWLKLVRPGIDLFYTESSDSMFYWDPRAKTFREVVMSD
jgi:hypothetical protein